MYGNECRSGGEHLYKADRGLELMFQCINCGLDVRRIEVLEYPFGAGSVAFNCWAPMGAEVISVLNVNGMPTIFMRGRVGMPPEQRQFVILRSREPSIYPDQRLKTVGTFTACWNDRDYDDIYHVLELVKETEE